MIRGIPCLAAALAIAVITLASGDAAADSACGGIAFANGHVQPRLALSVDNPDARCVSEIGAAIAARPYIRTVTVSVRLIDSQRPKAAGTAKRVASALVAAGANPETVSTVELAAFPGDAPTIALSYTERPAGKPIGQVHGVTGTVSVGRTDAGAAAIGTSVDAWSTLHTGDASYARVLLSDGTVLRLGPNTEVRIGPIDLAASLKPWVDIHLPRGAIEVASHAGSAVQVRAGDSQINAGSGAFVVERSAGATRVLAIAGAVRLGDTAVPIGHTASRADGGAAAAPTARPGPIALPPVVGGALTRGAFIQWDRVEPGVRYRVEIARDADLTRRLVVSTVDDAELAVPRELEPGRWYWRVTPVGADSAPGVPSKVGSFEVAR